MRAFQVSLTRSLHDPLLISVKAGQTSATVEQDVVRYRLHRPENRFAGT